MKKLIFIVMPILFIGGGVALAGRMGFINIPGLTPPKKKLADLRKKAAVPTEGIKKAAPKEPEPEVSKENPAAGQEKIAKLWDEMDALKLVALTEKWRPRELAPVLLKMDSGKVTELLSEMKPERSSEISREIQRLAASGS
ncbi:MAG: hypothetical protein ABL949_10190 [Fimbriimonadaceae bacterium]